MWLVDCSRANIFQMTTFHNGHKLLNNLCACINLNVWTCQKLSCRCRQDYKVNQPESYGKCLCGPRGNPVDMCSWDEIEWYRPKNQQFAIDEIPKGKLWIKILSSLKLTANNAPENWCKRKTIFLASFWEGVTWQVRTVSFLKCIPPWSRLKNGLPLLRSVGGSFSWVEWLMLMKINHPPGLITTKPAE